MPRPPIAADILLQNEGPFFASGHFVGPTDVIGENIGAEIVDGQTGLPERGDEFHKPKMRSAIPLIGGEVDLPRREMSVFECLLDAGGRLVSKTAVLDHVYGVGADAEETVVEVYASRLRRRLKPYGIVIRTRRGLGYQMLVETKA